MRRKIVLAALTLGVLSALGARTASAQTIQTIAGGGLFLNSRAFQVSVGSPYAVAYAPDDTVYVAATNSSVEKFNPATGLITTIAGNGIQGYSGDGGPATSAQLSNASGLAADSAGNLYIADGTNQRIRMVNAATGVISTVAGNGTQDYLGDGGPATSAELSYPSGVAVDGAGNLYIADSSNAVIRMVNAATGVITTVAGNRSRGGSYSGDGGPATSAGLDSPSGVAVDGAGNLYIADSINSVVRMVTAATGIITTVAGNGNAGYSGDGGLAKNAKLAYPSKVVVDGAGTLYIADTNNGVIRIVTAATGIITTVAGNGTQGSSGDGGPATSAGIDANDVAVDSAGNLYTPDPTGNRLRIVSAATGIISTVAGNGFYAYWGDGGSAMSAGFQTSFGVAVDAGGNVYFADTPNNVIRKVAAATGIISTVAGNGTYGYTGDGGPATSAEIGSPFGVAVDVAGNLYIADNGNAVIRMVTAATGVITTVAGNGTVGFSGDGGLATSAELWAPIAVAVDATGNLYIADEGNFRIRMITAATGIISTVAGTGCLPFPQGSCNQGDGGPATSASLVQPLGVAVDGGGNLYIADAGSNFIRMVAASTGIITTVAGDGCQSFGGKVNCSLGDGGPATSAQLLSPNGVAVDGAGNLYIADTENTVIRMVTAATGIISTVAGNGTVGYSGDGGPSTSAELDHPNGVAVDAGGNLYISDVANSRIRRVLAAPLTLTAPTLGSVVQAGQMVTIQWTGGPPLSSVNLELIDTVANAVATGVGTVPNSGSYVWTFPSALSYNGPCGRTYEFYIESPARTVYAYGPTFSVTCNSTPPSITPQVSGQLGTNGWYTSNVTVTWTVNDPLAPVISQTGCGATTISTDTTGQTLTCSATGQGGTASNSVTIKRDTTPPTVTGTPSPLPDMYGWNDTAVTVAFTGQDSTSGNASCSLPVVLTAQGANQTASGSCTDHAGNVGSASISSINIEFTAPSVTDVTSIAPSPTGWYTAPVTISFAGSDPLSGVLPTGCSAPITLTANGVNQAVTGTCVNRAGDVATVTFSGINIDTVPPIAVVTPTPPANAYGWNNTAVTVAFSGTDNLNGSGVANCTPSVTFSSEGAGQVAAGTCTDVAGNVSAPATALVKIDMTPPTVDIITPQWRDGFVVGESPASVFSCSDALSGVASCIAQPPNGASVNTNTLGVNAFSVVATDLAGNTFTGTQPYFVNPPGTPIITGRYAGSSYPGGVASDGAGHLYVVFMGNTGGNIGGSSLYRINAATGAFSRIAGNGTNVFGGDGGPAINATFAWPVSVAVDTAGNVFIAESGRIRRIDAVTGIITTFAGNGTIGFSGDDGPATNASLGIDVLNYSTSIAVDNAGNLYVGDTDNARVRMISAATGVISTVAGSGTFGFSGDGGQAIAASFGLIGGVAVDSAGNLFIADASNNRVRRVDATTGLVSTIAGNGSASFSGDGGAAIAASLNDPSYVAVDNAGNVYVGDFKNSRVRLVSPSGLISTWAGDGAQTGGTPDGGPANTASLYYPRQLAIDASDSLVIADEENSEIRRVRDTTYVVGPAAHFGSQVINTISAPQTITLTNRGVVPVAISSIALAGTNPGQFKLVTTSYISKCGASVAVGASCAIELTFAPTSAGSKAAVLTVNAGSGPGTKSVALTGTGGATYTVTPQDLVFGSVQTGTTSAAATVRLTNTGNAPLTVTGYSLGGTNAGQFQLPAATYASKCLATLYNPGQSCLIEVAFAPTSTGAKSALLNVTTGSGTHSVALSGTGIVPTYSVAPTSLAFGNEGEGIPSAAQAITVTNTGTLALPITSITLAPTTQFSYTTTCSTSSPLAVGATCTISVTFTPISTGIKSATIKVAAGGGATQQPAVTLSGTGIVPTYSLSPTTLTFPSQTHNTKSAPMTITVTNTGTFALPITSITLAPTTQFSYTTTCSTSSPLAVGATCTISVTFTPISTGIKSATIKVAAGGGATQQPAVTLSGTGT